QFGAALGRRRRLGPRLGLALARGRLIGLELRLLGVQVDLLGDDAAALAGGRGGLEADVAVGGGLGAGLLADRHVGAGVGVDLNVAVALVFQRDDAGAAVGRFFPLLAGLPAGGFGSSGLDFMSEVSAVRAAAVVLGGRGRPGLGGPGRG